ncbi:hypothetical protein AB0J71_49285, partial [Nonomuraea sp. NPDC049637]
TIPEPRDQRANRIRRGSAGGRPTGFDAERYKAIVASRPNDRINYAVDVKYDGAQTVVDRFRMRAELNGQVILDECVRNDLNGTVTDGIRC